MKAVAYLRVSSSGQVNGHGFDRQLDEVEAYCKSQNIELVGVFKEDVSGTKDETNRPAFQDMVATLLGNGCRTVIVEGLDRLARTLAVQEALCSYLAAKEITLISARTGENVTEALLEDPMRAAMVRMQGVFAQLEKELLVRKLRKAREAKRAKGEKCEGRPSISEVNPDVLNLIRTLKDAKQSYKAIAAKLNEAGTLSVTGKPWTATNVQSAYFRHK